jgi:hypothetical protein
MKHSLILKSFFCYGFFLFFALNSFAQSENIDAPILNSVLTGMDIENIKGEVNTVEISEHIARDSAGVIKKVKPWLFDHVVRFNSKNQVYKIDYTSRSCVKDINYKIDSSKFEYLNLDSCSFTKTVKGEIWLYDNRGNITEYSSSQNGVVDNKKVALFDENNKITNYKNFGYKGELLRESSFKYDEKGKLLECRQNNFPYISIYKYTYNASNLIQEELRFNEKGDIEWKTTYKYDSKLNLIEKSEYSGSSLSRKETYQYDAKGKKIGSITYDDTNIVINKSILKYDLNGILLEQKDQYYSENKLYEQQMKKYFSNGKVSESQTKTYDEQGAENSIFNDKFDQNGNLVENIRIDISDPKYPIKRIKKYEFDKFGNWIKKTETMPGDSNEFVVTERKINYR